MLGVHQYQETQGDDVAKFSSSMHIHELHSSTDAQARNMAMIDNEVIPKNRGWLDRSANNRVLRLMISSWVDVGASCQQNSIYNLKTRNKLNGIYF